MATKPKSKSKKAKEQKLPEFSERIELRHSFTDAEKSQILDNLSHKHEEKEMIVDQAKSSAKTWKGKIDEVQLKISELSQKGRDGYEMRPTECRVVLDRKAGKKHIYNKETDALIETREMSTYDHERLPIDDVPTMKPEPKPGEGLTNVGEAIEAAGEKTDDESHSE
jgi:hypothetical protein